MFLKARVSRPCTGFQIILIIPPEVIEKKKKKGMICFNLGLLEKVTPATLCFKGYWQLSVEDKSIDQETTGQRLATEQPSYGLDNNISTGQEDKEANTRSFWWWYQQYLSVFSASPCGSVVQNPPDDAGDTGDLGRYFRQWGMAKRGK